MIRGMQSLVEKQRGTLARLAGKMNALSPLGTLKRGYAVPLDQDGALLKGVSDFTVGREFRLRVLDGRIRAETKDIEPEEVDRE
jgi:exodeoxyribonuclease VII large subunit